MDQNETLERRPLPYLAGRVLATCLPGRRAAQQRVFTIPSLDADQPPPLTDRLIRYYLGHRHLASPQGLETLHRDFWRAQSPEDWYRFGEARHYTRHLPLFGEVFQALGPLLATRGIERVCEFGCGDGRWLAWLAQAWPAIREFRGVDLSSAQIERNRQDHPGLQFEAGHLLEWAEAHASPRTLFMTHCGVLEYLSQASVDRLLSALAQRAPGSMITLVEPVDARMDLSALDLPSHPHGDEFSWSHHYPARLRAAGCRVERQLEVDMDGYRMLVVVAFVPITAPTPSRHDTRQLSSLAHAD